MYRHLVAIGRWSTIISPLKEFVMIEFTWLAGFGIALITLIFIYRSHTITLKLADDHFQQMKECRKREVKPLSDDVRKAQAQMILCRRCSYYDENGCCQHPQLNGIHVVDFVCSNNFKCPLLVLSATTTKLLTEGKGA